MQKLSYLTALRGMAALGVAGGHIIGMIPPDHPYGSFFEVTNYERTFWPLMFGGEMVWLFLFISGFSLYRSEQHRVAIFQKTTLRTFAKRRFVRIAPTYYVGILMGLLILATGSKIAVQPSESLATYSPVTKMGIVSHMVFLHNFSKSWVFQINPPLWTIGVEMQLYILLPLFFARTVKRNPAAFGFALVLLIKGFSHLVSIPIFYYVEWFVSGIIVSVFIDRISVQSKILNVFIGISGICCLSRIFTTREKLYEAIWLIFIVSLVIRLQRIGPNSKFRNIKRLMLSVGNSSYSLYVVHFPIALFVWWLVSRNFNGRSIETIAMLIISCPLIALSTWSTYRFAEKPSIRLMTRISPVAS